MPSSPAPGFGPPQPGSMSSRAKVHHPIGCNLNSLIMKTSKVPAPPERLSQYPNPCSRFLDNVSVNSCPLHEAPGPGFPATGPRSVLAVNPYDSSLSSLLTSVVKWHCIAVLPFWLLPGPLCPEPLPDVTRKEGGRVYMSKLIPLFSTRSLGDQWPSKEL